MSISIPLQKKFEREFFGGGIPYFLKNSYLECEENVSLNEDAYRLLVNLKDIQLRASQHKNIYL